MGYDQVKAKQFLDVSEDAKIIALTPRGYAVEEGLRGKLTKDLIESEKRKSIGDCSPRHMVMARTLALVIRIADEFKRDIIGPTRGHARASVLRFGRACSTFLCGKAGAHVFSRRMAYIEEVKQTCAIFAAEILFAQVTSTLDT